MRPTQKPVSRLAVLMMLLLLVLASTAFAQALTEQQARQILIQANALRGQVLHHQLPELAVLENMLAQLHQVEAQFGKYYHTIYWDGPVPDAAKKLDVTTTQGARAYFELRRRHKDENWPLFHTLSLPWCMEALTLAKALRTGDVATLEAYTTKVEQSAAKASAKMLEARINSGGKGGIIVYTPTASPLYKQARARLLELKARIPAVVMVDNRPLFPLESQGQALLLPAKYALLWATSPVGTKWEPRQKRVTLKTRNKQIELQASSLEARVNGQVVKLTSAPVIQDGHLLISVRDVKPLFGLDYKWDSSLRAVHILPALHKG